MSSQNKVSLRKSFPDPNKISKDKPYSLCKFFAFDDDALARYTYIVYKEEKISWIEQQKRDNGKEPTDSEKRNHIENLTVDDYNKYVSRAHALINEDLQPLVTDALTLDIKNKLLKEEYIGKFTSLEKKFYETHKIKDGNNDIFTNTFLVKRLPKQWITIVLTIIISLICGFATSFGFTYYWVWHRNNKEMIQEMEEQVIGSTADYPVQNN